MPWVTADYFGGYFTVQGYDHIGFKVESIEAVKADIARVTGRNHRFLPRPFNTDVEGEARLSLFKRQCPFGEFHMADIDGVMIDLMEQDIPG